MRNNKQVIKLYTEEQVIEVFEKYGNMSAMNARNILDLSESIELPSDEEVEQYLKSFPYTKHLDDGQYNDGVIVGAELAIQWFRNKIQGEV